MLYVFYVDTGTMLTFDMNLAMESVSKLKEVIAKKCQIPEDKQVLLISGGQNLSPMSRVCSYSAGTDTNPIFLFSKNTIESSVPPSSGANYELEAELNEQVEGSMNIQPSYDAIVTRTQLALQFHDIAKERLKLCECLVHDQHLQHQGWAAVIANLEDIISVFKTKWLSINERINQHLKNRENNISILSSFPDTVKLLSKIPLLECLLPSLSISLTVSSSEKSTQSASDAMPGSEHSPRAPKTLLDWISAQESRGTLDQMAQQCLEGLHQFDEKVSESLKAEVENLLEAVDNPSMKEVKGLEDRLYSLEQLMYGAHKLVQEQGDMAQGFVQNQNRARNLQDPSVLPDLCNSHKRQLVVMLHNDQNLRDIHRRCLRAKDELSENLHTRLRWVMYVEKSICDVHGKLVIYNQQLKKLQHCLKLVLQMHNAPDIYCSAVQEVVRRRAFADSFIKWSTELCKDTKQIHDQELEKRQMFSTIFKNHFLKALFPGFDDKPSAFATKVPEKFDENLPPIKHEDIEFLKNEVPELAEKLSYHEDSAAPLVFPHVSFSDGQASSLRDCYSQTTSNVLVQVELDTSETPNEQTAEPDTTSVPTEREEGEECDSEETVVVEKESVSSETGPGSTSTSAATHPGQATSVCLPEQGISKEASGIQLTISSNQPRNVVSQAGEASHDTAGDGDGTPVDTKMPVPCTTSQAGLLKAGRMSVIKDEGGGKAERRDLKGTPDTSPDVDEVASEGFTTADFYIDESMPSSLTESAGRKLAELQQIIQDKTSQLEQKERELEEQRRFLDQLQPRLTRAQENFQLLHNVIQKGALQLRCDILSMEKQVQRDKDDYQSFMDSVTKNLIDTIARFEAQQKSLRNSQLEALMNEHSSKVQKLEEQLEIEVEKLKDAQSEIDIYDRKLKEQIDEIDSLKQNFAQEVEELRSQHEEELNTIRNQLLLEHEVEMEKVKSDLDVEVAKKDQEIHDIRVKIDMKDKEIESLKLGKVHEEEVLCEKFQKEKQEIQTILQLEYDEKMRNAEAMLEEKFSKSFEEEKERLKKESEEQLQLETEKIKNDLESEKDKLLCGLKEELEASHRQALSELQAQVAAEKEAELKDLKKEIEQEFEKKISEIKEAFEAERKQLQDEISAAGLQKVQKPDAPSLSAGNQTEEAELQQNMQLLSLSEDDVTSSNYQTGLQSTREEFEKEKQQAVEQALEEMKLKHEAEMKALREDLEKERIRCAQDMKTSIAAEKQIVFNEALSKLVADHQKELQGRDDLIAALQAEVEQLKKDKEETTEHDTSQITATDSDSGQRSIQQHLEAELAAAQQKILQLESQMATAQSPAAAGQPLGQSAMGQSVMSLRETEVEGKIQTLQASLRSKEDEVSKLQSKIMNLSMSVSCRGLVQDKVSITSCNVGELVLLCLDDQRANYVVFTVTNLLHFLHSDYLEVLGLKTGPGEPKKSWVLAEVTDKEYCQAKKPQNRYNVPVGTKFYRIKARPWSRESLAAPHSSPRQQHAADVQQPGAPAAAAAAASDQQSSACDPSRTGSQS